MTCEGCADFIKETLKNTPGVTDFDVSLEENRVIVEFDPDKTNEETIEKVLKETNFDIIKQLNQKKGKRWIKH